MGAVSTNPYTSQTISGYNSSPPPDDGTQTVANQLSWAKHKTKLADPIKTLAESINTAVSATFAKTINTDADVRNQISGSLALEWATATIGTDAISPTYSAVLLGTESGATADTLQTITATGVYDGALLTIRQRNATEEINLIHATSTAATATGPNIYLANKGNLRLDALGKAVQLQYDSNTASGWVETNIAGAWEDDVVASNTTTNIWFGGGETVHVSGSTTITSFGTAPYAGAWKKVIFDGALTLTHGANLSLPGSANITTAADDIAFVYADTTTQFDVLYFKKSGTPILVTGNAPTVQIFTSSGTYTKPAGLVAAIVEVCGGGGGGGGGAATGDPRSWASGGGGGASTVRRLLASSIGATETVTVGAGGAAGASTGGAGGAGGTSSFGALVDAPGGGGGAGAVSASTSYTGGAGGAAGSAGDVFFRGSSGGASVAVAVVGSCSSGMGGSSRYGGGGLALAQTAGAAGNDGLQYGGGGSGACGGAAGQLGGAGFKGVVIVTEYY